jgi:MFS family permease
MMLISGAVTPFSARIVERTGPRIPILTGLGLMAIGGIGLALLDPTTPTWILSALLVPIGLTGPSRHAPHPLPCCSTVSRPGEPAPPAAYSTPAAKSPVPLLSPSSGASSPPPPDSSTASKSAS